MKEYEHKHIVGFEETSLVGNVYYANFVRWQGRCREMFLRERVEGILPMLQNDFALVTTKVSCEFIAELTAFDELIIRMSLGALKQNRIAMRFEYWQQTKEGEKLVARGEQEVACMRRSDSGLIPLDRVPENLRNALESEF